MEHRGQERERRGLVRASQRDRRTPYRPVESREHFHNHRRRTTVGKETVLALEGTQRRFGLWVKMAVGPHTKTGHF